MQVNIACPGEEPRFGISSTGVGVEWSQLTQVTDLASLTTITQDSVTVDGLNSQSGLETFKYEIMLTPFRIIQYINDEITLVVNDGDTLRYAPPTAPHNTYMDGNDQLIEGYEIGLGFSFSAMNVYGLPQRASDSFSLPVGNYRLFNQDKFLHPYGTDDPLYGSWPYLTGHNTTSDASVVWMNSAETYVGIEVSPNSFTGQ